MTISLELHHQHSSSIDMSKRRQAPALPRQPSILVTDARNAAPRANPTSNANAPKKPSNLRFAGETPEARSTARLNTSSNERSYGSISASQDDEDVEATVGTAPNRTVTSRTGTTRKLNLPSRTTKTSQKLVLLPDNDLAPDEVPLQATAPLDPAIDPQLTKSVLQPHTEAERMTKSEREQAGMLRVTSYAIADSLRIKYLMAFLRREHQVQPRLYDEALYAAYHFPLLKGFRTSITSSPAVKSPGGGSILERDLERYENRDYEEREFQQDDEQINGNNAPPYTEPSQDIPTTPATPLFERPMRQRRYSNAPNRRIGEIFFFDYGVVVFFGFTESQELQVLQDLENAQIPIRPLKKDAVQTEEFHFQYDIHTQSPRIYNDFLTLRSGNHMIKLTVSHAIAQSTKLSVYESNMESTMSATQSIPVSLALTGTLPLSRKEVTQLSAQLFRLRVDVNLVSNVLDTPEFFWGSEPSLLPLYDAFGAYLEIRQRVKVLNERCKVVGDLLDMLHESIADSNMARITWIIIWLIVVAIFVAIGEVISRIIYEGLDERSNEPKLPHLSSLLIGKISKMA